MEFKMETKRLPLQPAIYHLSFYNGNPCALEMDSIRILSPFVSFIWRPPAVHSISVHGIHL